MRKNLPRDETGSATRGVIHQATFETRFEFPYADMAITDSAVRAAAILNHHTRTRRLT
jgi:hypothetical protein